MGEALIEYVKSMSVGWMWRCHACEITEFHFADAEAVRAAAQSHAHRSHRGIARIHRVA